MLTRLHIRDFAVVGEADVAFGPGLTVVSGETGAGKSLLIDALGLLSGSRADSGMVRHGADRAELSAEFELADAPEALNWLRENEYDDDNHAVIRRVLRADGGSRAWINGSPASASQLAELAERVLEIHGQHEHQALMRREHQLDLLDAFGGHQAHCAEVTRLAREWSRVGQELARLDVGQDPAERLDYLRHQLDELQAEALDAESLDRLLAEHRRAGNAAGLRQGCEVVLARINADNDFGLARSLAEARHRLAGLIAHEPRLEEAQTLLESAGIQIDEAASLLERLLDDFEIDPGRLDALEAHLARLHDLARKHRVPLDGLAERRDRLRDEVASLSDVGQHTRRLIEQREALAAQWQVAAQALSTARQAAAARLTDATTAILAELGMAASVFVAELHLDADALPSPSGRERVEFLISANLGQPPRPLRKVASGGELSRIGLAIEVAALGLDAVPTMIFDEVDSGIGGAVAEVVGRKLRALAASRQVLCVTHLPQVAAQGHAHLQVSKSIANAGSRSAVRMLSDDERVAELARMLDGLEIGSESIELARRMLANAG